MKKGDHYDIREYSIGDLWYVAANMRQQDKDEVWASHHLTPHQALVHSTEASRDTIFTGTADGVPICIFGVIPPSLLGNVAAPWMLGTDDVHFHSKAFLRHSRSVVRLFQALYPVLENYVDARNTLSIRFLQWVGFSVYYPEPWGRDERPFHRFDWRG